MSNDNAKYLLCQDSQDAEKLASRCRDICGENAKVEVDGKMVVLYPKEGVAFDIYIEDDEEGNPRWGLKLRMV